MKTRNKVIGIAAVGALVAAGFSGTYALWTATQDGEAATTIATGDLNLTTSKSSNNWQDVSGVETTTLADGAFAEAATINPSTFVMSPGDTIAGVVKLEPTLSGDNLVANLSIESGLDAAVDNVSYEYKLFDKDGNALDASSIVFKSANFQGTAKDFTAPATAKIVTDTAPIYVAQIVKFDRATGERNTVNTEIKLKKLTATLTQDRGEN